MSPQAQVNEKRNMMLAGIISHDEYYLWLADEIGIPERLIPASKEEIRNSKDPYLNDIPLARWDRMDASVRRFVGGLSWSLSDSVCVLKALAKRRKENEHNHIE